MKVIRRKFESQTESQQVGHHFDSSPICECEGLLAGPRLRKLVVWS